MSTEPITRLVARCTADPAVNAVTTRLADAGHDTYVVGGPVRDALDGVDDIHDIDLVTLARPEQVTDLLQGAGTVNLVGDAFGVVKLHRDGTDVDIATARADRYVPGTRKPDVTYADTVTDDLIRRDFTVNAMAVRLPTDPTQQPQLLDPHDGQAALKRRMLDTPTDPAVSFGDDPLRIHRAWRFAATRSFRLADRLFPAARTVVDDGLLAAVSAERKQAEAQRVLEHPEPTAWAQAITLMVQLDVFADVFPGLHAAGRDFQALWRTGSPAARLAGLFATRWPDGHRTARDVLTMAKWPNATIADVAATVELAQARRPAERRQLIRKHADHIVDAACELSVAEPTLASETLLVDAARRHLWRLELPIGGNDVMAAGIPAGPQVGQALAAVSTVLTEPQWAHQPPHIRREWVEADLATWLADHL